MSERTNRHYPDISPIRSFWSLARFEGVTGLLKHLDLSTDPNLSGALAEAGFSPADWPTGGLIAPANWDTEGRVVLVSADTADALRRHLLNLDPEREESVVEFCEKWGLLGLGIPIRDDSLAGICFGPHQVSLEQWLLLRQAIAGADSLRATRCALKELRRLVFAPERLLDFWREAQKLRRPEDGEGWASLQLPLGMTGFRPRIMIPRLVDVLLVALAVWGEEARPRQCKNPRCLEIVFDSRRQFHDKACANRYFVALAKRKTRVMRHLKQGASIQQVVKRYRLAPELVRSWQQETRRRRRNP